MPLSSEQIDAFLKAELADWLKYAETTLKNRLRKQNLVETNNLVSSIKAHLSKPVKDNSATATIDFAEYGRILDILGYRRIEKSKAIATRGGIKTKSKVKTKNKKWYSRTKQGVILNLVERLVTTEAEAIAKGLADSIEQKSPI